MMRVAAALLLLLAVTTRAHAQGGAIIDPENPGAGAISDPENPGAGAISDPENATPAVRPAPARPTSTGAPRALFRGSFASGVSLDWRREDTQEDTIALDQRLDLRVRYRLTDRWSATLEGRLTWWMTGAGDADRSPIVPDLERWQGRLRPELRDAFVAGRAGGWLFRFGQQSIVWGSTDITRPADVINPRDLTGGWSTAPGDLRVPIPALEATRTLPRGSWQFALVPFFVPHRVDIYGSDGGLLGASEVVFGRVAVSTLDTILSQRSIIDPSLDDLTQPLLLQTELPEETLRNVSGGTRLAYSWRGWDLALGYFYGWDRTPFATLAPEGFALLSALARGGGPTDPVLLEAASDALARTAAGERLYNATYRRLHTIETDGVTYAGPIGIRWELVVQPERTTYTADLRAIRRPTLTGALGLGYENGDGSFVISIEGLWQETFARAADGAYLLDLDRVVALAGGLQLGLDAFGALADRRVGDLAIQLGGLALPASGDWVLAPELSFAVSDRLDVATGVTWYGTTDRELGVGELLDGRDAWWFRVTRAF